MLFSLVTSYIWKKFLDYGLGGKGTYKFNLSLLFNSKFYILKKEIKYQIYLKKLENNLI